MNANVERPLAIAVEPRLLDPQAAYAMLQRYGIETVPQRVVRSDGEAADAAAELGFPVAVKAFAPDLVHKTEAGAVRLNLTSALEVREAAAAMSAAIAGIEQFVVQRMATGDHELLVGATRDPVFGPAVAVGLGGVFAELLGEVVLRLAPISTREARAMLAELRAGAVLDGFRGARAIDVDSLLAMIVAVGDLMCRQPEVAELDLNPVVAGVDGVVAVDVRVLCGAAAPRHEARPPAPQLRHLLAPESIVVIGASSDQTKVGGLLFRYLRKHGFAGDLYAVNPNAEQILGIPCHASVAELPETPELACVVVPAALVAETVVACARRGIDAAIVYTAGFAEAGVEGAVLQRNLLDSVQELGIRVCGPNTAGVVNVGAGVFASTAMALESEDLPAGGIALLTQSGAIGSSLLSRSWAHGVGVGAWVSVGNEADLTISDYLLHFAEDPDTTVIGLFLEAIRDPATFIEACERARAHARPIVAYKTGASETGRKAVESHTGALAGDAAIYDAAFRSLGVVAVTDLQSLLDVTMAFDWQPLPTGARIAVVSGSGGACSVIADELAKLGLLLPALSPELTTAVQAVIPPFGAAQNPVDVTAQITRQPEMVGQVASALLESGEFDALLVMLTTNADPPATEVARGVITAARASGKPVLVARLGAESLAPTALALYREARIPVYPMPDRAARTLKAMVDYGAHVHECRHGAGERVA